MKALYLPLLLVVGGNILYHVSQKSIPKSADPLVVMLLAYTVAFSVCLAATAVFPSATSFLATVREARVSAVVLGLGIAAVEIGVLLAYRGGWRISVLPVVSSAAVSLLLLPVGLLVYREQLSFRNGLGIACCLLGLFLLRP